MVYISARPGARLTARRRHLQKVHRRLTVAVYRRQSSVNEGLPALVRPGLRDAENFRQLAIRPDAQQRVVEFLIKYREWDKLVDFYNEIGQYVRAQETCEQQARTHYSQPSLDNRIHWFRQAAKAASLAGRAHKQKDFDFQADLCNVQKRLHELIDLAQHEVDYSHYPDDERLSAEITKEKLCAEVMTPQVLFNTAINWSCWEVALEVMDLLHGMGSMQPDFPSVVVKLWTLLLARAWNTEGSVDDKWAKVELMLMDVGRRYVDKPDLLPLSDVVEWLEKQQATENAETRVQQMLRDMEVDVLKLIRVYTQLHDGALRNRSLQVFAQSQGEMVWDWRGAGVRMTTGWRGEEGVRAREKSGTV